MVLTSVGESLNVAIENISPPDFDCQYLFLVLVKVHELLGGWHDSQHI